MILICIKGSCWKSDAVSVKGQVATLSKVNTNQARNQGGHWGICPPRNLQNIA